MSAAESVYGNEHALAYDPWVKDGLAEDSLQNMVAPYINSAKEGVEYLGRLIKSTVLLRETESCFLTETMSGTWKSSPDIIGQQREFRTILMR